MSSVTHLVTMLILIIYNNFTTSWVSFIYQKNKIEHVKLFTLNVIDNMIGNNTYLH